MKFQVAPCQNPILVKISKIEKYLQNQELEIRISGLKKYSFIHVVNDICHRCHNSEMEADKYGRLKFGSNLIPNNRADPIAISVYPEKSA